MNWMKRPLKIGTVGRSTFLVEPEHGIDITGDPNLAVLSTPSLIWFLEKAARQAVSAVLEPDYNSAGVHIDVQHLAATPLGHRVTCTARVIHIDGPSILFQVEACDQHETIAKGMHRRRTFKIDRFADRVRRKAERAT